MIYTLKDTSIASLRAIEEEKGVRQTKELFLLFSLGSQFDHLIKQELEKLGVFCLVADSNQVTVADVQKVKPTGIILSGGPVSVYRNPPPFDGRIFDLGIPILGICLGFQLWAKHIGVPVSRADKREFGIHKLTIVEQSSSLFYGCEDKVPVLESHGDRVELDAKLNILAQTANAPVAAAWYQHLWGVQFHPEVTETTCGPQIFENFCFRICGTQDRYPARDVAKEKIRELKEQIGDKKVLLALSGGSDSSTVAYLLKHALAGRKGQLRAVYIRGMDRPDDEAHVLKFFGNQDWLELVVVDATAEILKALQGKETMYAKRVAVREVYKAKLEEEAKRFGAGFIAQGTLYTDISESGGGYDIGAKKAQIKLHHNVGLGFSLTELIPLADCVKDNARNIGRSIAVPEELLSRHPFPGPGLVVRIEGEVTADKLRVARCLDGIYIAELRNWGLYEKIWQAGVVVTSSQHTCTKGDDAVSGYLVMFWAVWSMNGFTAQAAKLPDDFVEYVSQRFVNEVKEVGAVAYRTSGKPPTTIEVG